MLYPEKLFWHGGMNWDDDPRLFQPGDYLYALNGLTNSQGKNLSGDFVRQRGNVEISYPLPAGQNRCIGTLKFETEDNQESVIYWVWNSNGNHSILRYFPNIGTVGEIQLISQDSIWNFDKHKFITGAGVVGDIVYWTDNYNHPRKLDYVKANTTNKKQKWNFFMPEVTGNSRTVQIEVFRDLVSQGTLSTGIVGFSGNKLDEMAHQIASVGVPDMTAEACGGYVHLEGNNLGNYSFTCVITDGAVITTGYFQPVNFYTTLDRSIIDDVPYPPNCQPSASYKADPTRSLNFLEKHTFQFMTRYRYFDGSVSTLSPYSKIPLDTQTCGGVSTNNYIEVDFSAPELANTATLCNIKAVEICFRESNTGEVKSAKILNQEDFVMNPVYRFYNDGMFEVIAPEVSSKLYDNQALRVSAMDFSNDQENFRKFEGGLVEGYDTPCPVASFRVLFNPYSSFGNNTGTATGTVRILNAFTSPLFDPNSYSAFNQPIGWTENGTGSNPGYMFGGMGMAFYNGTVGTDYKQWIPEGGFPIYSAGTPYIAISNQNYQQASAGCYPSLVANNNGKNVYDLSRNGNPIFGGPANSTYKAACRELMRDNNVYSTFSLDLPPGRHTLRMASHLCSFDDKLGLGDKYNLNSQTRQYQKTSTQLIGIGNTSNKEVVVVVPPTGGSFPTGEWFIMDLADAENITDTTAVTGYAIDNNGSGDTATLFSYGETMELQRMQFVVTQNAAIYAIALAFQGFAITQLGLAYAVISSTVNDLCVNGVSFTDHNGFYFWSAKALIPGTMKVWVATTSVTGIPATPYGPITITPGIPPTINPSGALVLKGFSQNWYEGDWSGITGTIAGGLTPVGALKQTFVYNTQPDYSNFIKTHVEGYILNFASGAGIKDVACVLGRGKFTHTSSTGFFSITAFADASVNLDNRVDDLNLIYSGDCSISFITNPVPINIQQFDQGQPYSMSFFYDIGIVYATVNSSGVQKTLKRGAKYPVGLVYYDGANRSTTTGNIAEIYIPHYTEDLNKYYPDQYPAPNTFLYGTPYIEINILNNVPIPEVGTFTHYQIVVGTDTVNAKYLQWLANEVKYVGYYDTTNNQPVEVGYNSASANEIYIGLQNIAYYQEVNSDSGVATQWSSVGYEYTQGDRLRILQDDEGNFFSVMYDLPIVDNRGEWLIIENVGDLPELKRGFMFEIYTPGKSDSRTYFEIGECYPINDPFGASPTHSQVQVILGHNDAGNVGDGIDTYYRSRLLESRIQNQPTKFFRRKFEDASISDFYTSNVADYGRPNTDVDAKQLNNSARIRWSNAKLEGSEVNGLSSFDAVNYTGTSEQYGGITSLKVVNNIMLILCRNKALAGYIGKGVIYSQDGDQSIQKTNGVIGTINELNGENGCIDPMSVKRYQGRVWWWNQYKGIVCQYDNNGINNISGKDHVTGHDSKMQKFFDGVANVLFTLNNNQRKVTAWIDPYNKLYCLSFEPVETVERQTGATSPLDSIPNPDTFEGYTLFYDFAKGRWVEFFSIQPEAGSEIGMGSAIFTDGKFWLQYRNEHFGNFCGNNYPSQISLVSNGESPDFEKAFRAMEEQANDLWFGSRVWNTRGQESVIPSEGFKQINDNYHSPIWRDMNSPAPNGEIPLTGGAEMRSHSLFITFENNSDLEAVLRAVYVKSQKSERTVK